MKLTKQKTEEIKNFLNERFQIYCIDKRQADFIYYEGLLKMVEMFGFWWKRNENGKHSIFED